MRQIAIIAGLLAWSLAAFAADGTSNIDPALALLASPDYAKRVEGQAMLEKIPAGEFWRLSAIEQAQTDPEIKARLFTRMAEMAPEVLQTRRPDAPLEVQATIAGTVIGLDGKPVADATVVVSTFAINSNLRLGFKPAGKTDGGGRFSIGVPYRDVSYLVTVRSADYVAMKTTALSDFRAADKVIPIAFGAADVAAEYKIAPAAPRQECRGTVVDENGMPATNQTLFFSGAYDDDYSTRTGPNGEFTISTYKNALRYAVPMMNVNERVLPAEPLKDVSVPIRLALGSPASFYGTVHERGSGKPVPGATVILSTNNRKLAYRARVAPDGSYTFTGLPPGTYQLMGEAPAHFDRPVESNAVLKPMFDLRAGKAEAEDIVMSRSAILMGQVLDPAHHPVPDALVGVKSGWQGDYRDQWVVVQSDGEGRYLIPTGHTGEELVLCAYAPGAGHREITVPVLHDGELRKVAVDLPGTVHVKGVVTDAAGKPIEHVVAYVCDPEERVVLTGADGAFDFGGVSLNAGGEMPAVHFNPPRPRRGTVPPEKAGDTIIVNPLSSTGLDGNVFYQDVTSRETVPAFYGATQRGFGKTPARPGETQDMKVVLAPAHLLELTGTVADADGKPAANAEVYLLNHDAEEATWKKSARMMKPDTMLRTDSTAYRELRLAETRADAQGHWTIYTIREELLPVEVRIAAYAKGQEAFLPLKEVPKGDEKMEIAVQLHEPAQLNGPPPAAPKR